MGGDYYDRDVEISNNNVGGYSDMAQKIIGGNTKGHQSLNPTRWEDELLENKAKNPIVFALDDTGSMGDWTKVIYDKLPMFYGQIMIQKYLEDPAISFCAIGDHNCCTAPLQVSEFGQGVELDQMISKLYMEGNGGGNEHESYELAAYFYQHRVDLGDCEFPFFFVTGDEGYFEKLQSSTIKTWLGVNLESITSIDSFSLWQEVMKKYNVFHLKKPYISKNYETKIRAQWENTLTPERVLVFNDPKAIIDVTLGLMATTTGSRTLEEYLKDMEQRGQSKDRIELVKSIISPYYHALKTKKIVPVTKKSIEKIDISKSSNESDDRLNISKVIYEGLNDNEIQYMKELSSLTALIFDKIEDEYKCPLTNTLFFNPVIAADGRTYERKAVQYCIDIKSKLVSEEVIKGSLIPNTSIKNLIKKFYEENKNKLI